MQLNLIPYLSFQGDCEEAFNMYKNIFGGTIEIVQRYDNPAMKAPAEWKEKVLHAHFKGPGFTFFGADMMHGSDKNSYKSNIALSLDIKDPEEGKKIFDQLANGGSIGVPYEKQFWGDWHGNLTDRFGIRWMMNSSQSGS